jgi:hypothetical protein
MTTSIPDHLSHLPEFKGYAIPFTTLVNNHGIPDFHTTNGERWKECVENKLCAVCGKDLQYWVWYYGKEPNDEETTVYFDPGMHKECAEYLTATNYEFFDTPVPKQTFIEKARRSHEKPRYLARGRKSAMKYSVEDHYILPGTLMETVPVPVR